MIDVEAEPITIGLSTSAHGKLQRLKEDGIFAEMADGYRFAIGLALAHGVTPQNVGAQRNTIFNVGSLDPDKSIFFAVQALRSNSTVAVYREAERLAEWGVEEMFRRAQNGSFSFAEILREADALL